MGNSTGGSIIGSKEVVLCLHAVHNVQHQPNESYYGMASDSPNDSVGVAVTSERPAKLVAGIDTVLTVRVFLHERGAPSSADRLVGHVAVPIREMLALCGAAIYQTWFLLDTAGPGETDSARQAERFRHSFRGAAAQIQQPRICLTLVEATTDATKWLADEASRDYYYGTLLASHRQNWQMIRSYFEHLDGLDDGKGSMLPPLFEDSQTSGGFSGAESRGLQPDDLRNQLEKLQHRQLQEEVASLQSELDQVTEEANRRIEKGNDSILKLKVQFKHQRDTEFPELQQHRADAQGRLCVLRRRNEELKDQLASDGSGGFGLPSGEDMDEEIDRLQKEVLVTTNQKEALMEMVRNIYGGDDATQDGDFGAEDSSSGYAKLLPDPHDVLGDSTKQTPWRQ